MEKACFRTLKEYAPKILGKNVKKIKEIKIIFIKDYADWNYGFNWLFNKGVAIIGVPRFYRSIHRAQWLIIHELAHLKQIVEKRFKCFRLDMPVKYARPRGKLLTYKDNGVQIKCIETGRTFERAPWEEEVWKLTQRSDGSKLKLPKGIHF